MKKYRALIVAAGLLIVAVVAYILLMAMPTQQDPIDVEDQLIVMPTELIAVEEQNLKSVTVEAQNSFSILATQTTQSVENAEDIIITEYALSDDMGMKYSQVAMKTAADSLRYISVEGEPIAVGEHSEYGLDNPSAIVTVVQSDGETVYEIGDEAPGSEGYYAKFAGSDEVWLIPADTAMLALGGSWQFRDKLVFGYEQGEEYTAITSFSLERSEGETIAIGLVGEDAGEFSSTFRLTQPLLYEANDVVLVEDVFAYFSNLSYNEIVEDSPQDLTIYGIPNLVDESEEGDQTEVENANEQVNPYARITLNDELVITLGDFTDDTNSFYYATVSGVDSVVTFPVSAFPFIEIEYSTLLTGILWLHNIKDVESFEVISPSSEDVIVFNHMQNPDDSEDTWMEPTLNGESIEEDAAKDVYLEVLSITIDNVIEGEPAAGELEYSITINKINGESYNMSFYRINERNYGVVMDGQTLPFYVNIDLLTLIEDLIAQIEAGEYEA